METKNQKSQYQLTEKNTFFQEHLLVTASSNWWKDCFNGLTIYTGSCSLQQLLLLSYIYIYIYIYIHICYMYVCYNIYMQSWKQCALPVITTMACSNSCTWAQSHCGDNRAGTLFHDCIYIMPNLLLEYLSPLCVVDHLWPLIYMYVHICIYV